MDVLILIGRILFAGLFLFSAVGHFTQSKAMAGFAQSRGVPLARAAVVASGVVMALGALGVLLGVWPDLGALLLVVFLVPTAAIMHGFWRETDPQARYTEMIQFFKDLSLAGAALLLVGVFAEFGQDIGVTITGPLFG